MRMFRVEMLNSSRFYTYAYLREDRTPYYIGKGQTNRIYQKSGKPCGVPKDKSRIIFLKQNITEEEAFRHERYMIAVFGRKCDEGILYNKSLGGEGTSGYKMTEEQKIKLSQVLKGRIPHNKGKPHTEETRIKIGTANRGKRSYWKGRKLSDDVVEKIKKAIKGKVNGENNGRAKSYQITFIDGTKIIIKSLQTWAKENGYNPSSLRNLYNGNQKTKHKDIVNVVIV